MVNFCFQKTVNTSTNHTILLILCKLLNAQCNDGKVHCSPLLVYHFMALASSINFLYMYVFNHFKKVTLIFIPEFSPKSCEIVSLVVRL